MKKIYQCPSMEAVDVRFSSMLMDSVPGEKQKGDTGNSFGGGAPQRKTSPF